MSVRRPRSARVLVAAVLLFATLAGACATLARRVGLHRVEIAGESMSPALLPGDFVVLRAGPPRRGREYGHIVAVRDPRPEGDGRLLLKRVIGLPGESLRIGGGPVQINGQPLIEPYAHGEGGADQHRGINRLERDEYFIVGDHRGASTDSRDFGPVRREQIEGTALWCYWPPERAGRLRPPVRQLAGPAEGAEAPSMPSPGGRSPRHESPIPVFRADRRDEGASPSPLHDHSGHERGGPEHSDYEHRGNA